MRCGPMTRRYFYPRSPCGERLVSCHYFPFDIAISIHALLAESDLAVPDLGKGNVRFLSTLSLRRATYGRINDISRLIFLSTLSLRRATLPAPLTLPPSANFYPRSPCGERLYAAGHPRHLDHFYPRSPCGERPIFAVRPYDAPIFLSTLSLRRATPILLGQKLDIFDFYPRSPCGERPLSDLRASL